MVGSARALGTKASHLIGNLTDYPLAPALIGRLRSTKDRRHVNIIPTQKGRVLMEHMMPMVDRIHNDFMQRVTTAEWAEFNRILDKLSEPTEKRNLT